MKVERILTTTNAKSNFLKGLIRIAKCDGVVDEDEFTFFQQAAQALGLGNMEVKELEHCWKEDEKIAVAFDTSKEKMFFFIQAIQLCWVDDKYTDVEKQEMRSIAKELGISFTALETVEKWAYEGIVWNKKSADLLEML